MKITEEKEAGHSASVSAADEEHHGEGDEEDGDGGEGVAELASAAYVGEGGEEQRAGSGGGVHECHHGGSALKDRDYCHHVADDNPAEGEHVEYPEPEFELFVEQFFYKLFDFDPSFGLSLIILYRRIAAMSRV